LIFDLGDWAVEFFANGRGVVLAGLGLGEGDALGVVLIDGIELGDCVGGIELISAVSPDPSRSPPIGLSFGMPVLENTSLLI
jgi:hypothetical protein